MLAEQNIRLSLILPAYNESRSIGRTLEEIRAYLRRKDWGSEIIVSADGTDGTRELVRGMADSAPALPALRVIGDDLRRGKGHGVKTAVAMAEGDIIGYMDADNKTSIDELDKFLPLLDEGFDVVIGSRRHAESLIERPQPLDRKLLSLVFHGLVHALVGLKDIPDTQCGFKFFRREAARDLFGRQTIAGYVFDVELLRMAQLSGYRIAQVPVRWRDDGDSRANLSGNLRNLADLARIRLRH